MHAARLSVTETTNHFPIYAKRVFIGRRKLALTSGEVGPRKVFHNSLENDAISRKRLRHGPAFLVHRAFDQQGEPFSKLQCESLQIPFVVTVQPHQCSVEPSVRD